MTQPISVQEMIAWLERFVENSFDSEQECKTAQAILRHIISAQDQQDLEKAKINATFVNCPYCNWLHDTEGLDDVHYCDGCHQPFARRFLPCANPSGENGRLLPELPEGYIVRSIHRFQETKNWKCRIAPLNTIGKNIFSEGPTPREAVLSAISKIQERG